MAKYQSQNSRVISAAFKRFREQYMTTMTQGYCEIAEMALEYLAQVHRNSEDHHRHIQDANTIGYAVGYNGQIITSHGYAGSDEGELPGRAKEMAESIIAGHTSGWSLAVLSEMGDWYDYIWEDELIGSTMGFTRLNFLKFFRQIEQQ